MFVPEALLQDAVPDIVCHDTYVPDIVVPEVLFLNIVQFPPVLMAK